MSKRHYFHLVICCFTLLVRGQERTQWIALDGQSKPGTPIQAVVTKTSSDGTTFELKIPGVWMDSMTYGGRTFTKLLLPAVQLGGIGFPQRAGERGWYDFPVETGQAPMPPDRFVNALSISVPKPLFPQGALSQKPRTGAEMERLGINPAGARPGIPALRGMVAVSRANLKGDISLERQNAGGIILQLPNPLAPAGFEGSDITAPPNEGYSAPPLIDEEFYANFKGLYQGVEDPLSEISGAGAGFATVEARVPLMELTNPQIVRVLTNVLVFVKHLKGTEDFSCPISWDAWTCLFPYINGAALRESITAKGLKIEASRSAHYLITTPRVYRDELNEFALWKQAKGLNVDFAYVGTAASDDVAPDRVKIDIYLEEYFKKNYCHGVYVLLVGDVDVIPSGRSSRVTAAPDAADADSDHVYEVLGSDRFPSLYVGRLSVNSAAELNTQLAKILSYERDPVPGDWPTRATLAANSQNDDGSMGVSASFPSKYAGAVNAIASYGGYASPPTFQKLHAGAATTAGVRAINQDVIDAIQQGRGQVLYRGHGDGSGWVFGWDGSSTSGSSFTAGTHLRLLSNKIYPIVYAIACQNARLRNNDAIAEAWMSWTNGGAVAHWGANVNSFTDENHERAKGVFRALYESEFTRLGPALAEAERISHGATGGGDAWDSNTFAYNLLGDPELTVRQRAVSRLRLTGLITNINLGVLIKVSDQLGVPPPPGCFVQATLGDGRTINGFANASGELTLPGVSSLQVASVDLQSDGYGAATITNPRPTRQWIAFDANAEPGTPATVSLLKADQTNTSLRVHIPGVWVNINKFGGREVATLEFPNLDNLVGPGIPQKPGERGWFDFPPETGIAPLPPARFQHPFEQGIFHPVFPKSALGKTPATEREMLALGVDPAGARPGIPTLRGFLAVSRLTRPEQLSIDFANSIQKDVSLPAPLRPAGFTGSDQAAEIFGYDAPELFDEEFYATFKGAYRGPEKPIERSGSVGAFGVAEMKIPLAEINTPMLAKVYSDLVILVKHLQGTEDFECPFSWDSWLFNLPFINGDALRASMTVKGIKIEGSRSAHYLIVTPRVYRGDLNEFALWKQAKGLNVDFAYVGAAATDDIAADRNAIDAYLESYFKKNYCHGVYVLLVGDVDVIPSGRSTRVDSDPDGADADSDHIYEVLGSDRFPSLYVGRLSINSSAELKTQLAKILSYEKAPIAGTWPTRATLAANSQNDDGTMGVSPSFPSKYAVAVNAVAGYVGYTSPPSFQVLHAGAATAAATRAVNLDVLNAIHEGRGIVLYRGHGSGTAWVSGWDGSSSSGTSWSAGTHVVALTNRAYPIVFSIACQNARLRNSDAIAESWMSQASGGAVAHFGASVNSYTSENHERAKGLFRALYESGFTRLGPALAEGERISYTVTAGGAGWDNNTFCYNLLGDPELTVRKRAVLRFSLLAAITNNSAGVVVSVRDEQGSLAPGCFVQATLMDGRTMNGFANASGDLTLPGVASAQVAFVDLQADGYNAAQITNPRSSRQWIALDPNAPPGAPVSVSLLKSDQTNTSVRFHIPGVWVNVSTYGGREVSTLEFPNLDKLIGPGIPVRLGDRGWYDFPEETGIAPVSPARYQHPFEQGVYQPVYPKSALGNKPATEREMLALGVDPAGARPGIPTLRGFLAVSRATGPEELAIDFANSTQKDIPLPAPLRPAGYTGSDQAAEIFGYDAPELFDEEFYAAFKGSYRGPEKPVERSGSVGAFGLAAVNIPLAEVSTVNLAKIYTDLFISVKHLKGTEDFVCPFSWDSWLFHLPFINGDALRSAMTAKGIRIEGSRSAHYLIVTPREYRSELNEFALWKQSKGLNVDFAYVGTAGTDDVAASRTAIDAYLESYFKLNYCHGVYVLLVGDVDVIPSGRSTRVDSDPDGSDADSDHVYEVLGGDRFPSLYVGRLSVNSVAELKIQLAKILSYEKSPISGNWPTRATLAANSQNDDGTMGVSPSFPSKYAAAVNAVAGYGGYTSPPSFQILHAGAATAAATRAVNLDVSNAIHEGRGIVLYRGHGSGTAWVSGWDGSSSSGTSWSAGSHVAALTNRAYPIVFSIACQNARLRNSDAIAEAWLSQANGGAVAHFGASVNSYTSENHERAKGLFRALYESGFTRLGPALAEGERISYAVTGGGAGWDNNTFCYNLLGDPELTVRKQNIPFNIAIIPSVVLQNLGTLISLKDSTGNLVSGALVNILLSGSLEQTNLFSGPNGALLLAQVKPEDIVAIQVHADGYQFSETEFGGPAQAFLTALGFGREGMFSLQIDASQGVWTIQGSTDFIQWQSLGTIDGGTVRVFTDPASARSKYRFYRAVPGNRL